MFFNYQNRQNGKGGLFNARYQGNSFVVDPERDQLRRSSSAFYLASNYNSDYDVLPNLSGLTGDAYFRENLFPTLARVYGGVGYLPNVSGNYFSTPDSAALDITGNIEIIARIQVANYSSLGADFAIIAKRSAAATINYQLFLSSSGGVCLAYSPNNVDIRVISQAAIPAPANSIAWVKVTRNAATGVVSAFYSLQQTQDVSAVTWIANGTNAGTVEGMAVNTAPLEVGSFAAGTANRLLGNVYYASVANAIDGAPAAIFNPSAVPNYAYGWRASTGEDWTTVVSTAYDLAATYKVAPAQLGSAGFYTNARIWGGRAYLPAVSNYFSAPYTAAMGTINSDIDIKIDLALADWTPATQQRLLGRWNSGGGGQPLWTMTINTSGALLLYWVDNASVTRTRTSTANLSTLLNNERRHIRATLDADNGAGGHDVKFYTSFDGVTWTQLGTTITTAGTTDIRTNAVNAFSVGCTLDSTATEVTIGVINSVKVSNAIDGEPVINFDPSLVADMATSWVAATGETYTVTKSASSDTNDPTRLVFSGEKYTFLNGWSNHISTPDAAPLDITGDIDIRVRVALNSYTSQDGIIGKFQGATERSWTLNTNASRQLVLSLSSDGSTILANASTAALSVSDRQTTWLRATFLASASQVNFFTSNDGITWTQLGTTVAVANSSIYNSNAQLTIGGFSGTGTAFGNYYYAEIRNGIDGTVVAKYDASLASTNGYTDPINSTVWTHNRSATGKKLSFVDRTLLLLATDDYAVVADHPLLDISATDSFTIIGAARTFGSQASPYAGFVGKGGATGAGYQTFTNLTAQSIYLEINDGTTASSSATGLTAPTAGTAWIGGGIRSVADDTVTAVTASVLGTPVTDATTGTLANALAFYAGRRSSGTATYWEGEVFGFSLFRKALTTNELAALKPQLGAY